MLAQKSGVNTKRMTLTDLKTLSEETCGKRFTMFTKSCLKKIENSFGIKYYLTVTSLLVVGYDTTTPLQKSPARGNPPQKVISSQKYLSPNNTSSHKSPIYPNNLIYLSCPLDKESPLL